MGTLLVLAIAGLSGTAQSASAEPGPRIVVGAAAASTPDSATEPSATITGSVGARVTEDSSSLRLRYVGDPAPAGYDGSYQLGPAILTPSPEQTPVTIAGTLNLSGMSENGETAVIGLHDAGALVSGQTGHKQEVGIYVTYRTASGGYYDVGVTDGDAGGGEWVQAYKRIPVSDLTDRTVTVEFVVDGRADPATCVSDVEDTATAAGCMTLTVAGTGIDSFTVKDSYGSISPDGVTTELGNGAHPGWYTAFESDKGPEIGVLYDLTISPSTNVVLDDTTPTVTVTDSTQPLVIEVDSGTTDAGVNYGDLLTDGAGTIPQTTITSSDGVTVKIPRTRITATDKTWDGVIKAPTVVPNDSVTIPAESGTTVTIATAIEVGAGKIGLEFDKGVRLLLPGQADQLVGFERNGTFTPITTECVADSQDEADKLDKGRDCYFTVGTDMVIWTKHFTTFVAYSSVTAAATPALAELAPTGAGAPGPALWVGGALVLVLGSTLLIARGRVATKR
ncbi:surface proteins containing Ig-like protein [Leifsonia rubra CMS 76R]|nr:surface proteins containing Ig-like protein [Leifsonia rubra CMS 76R]